MLPEQEREGLTTADWMDLVQHDNVSFDEAITNDDPCFARMFEGLCNIETMLFHNGPIVGLTLDLPIEEARDRLKAARQAAADAREAARWETERLAKLKRNERLIATAAMLGPDGAAWIETANARLSGQRPVDMAQSGENGLDCALLEIEREVGRRHVERERQERVEGLRLELAAEVEKILGEAAKPFLASPYRELQRRKPLEYCVCRRTLQECLDLANEVRRARNR